MISRSVFIAAAIALCAPAALAQATPAATLERFVALANAGELTSAEGQSILTGEARQMATSAKSALPAVDRIIPIGKDKAAARFVLRGPNGEEADAYFYLEKGAKGWAVSAYRSMGISPIDMMLLNELKKRKQLTPEEDVQKRNLQLLLSTDSQLRIWFTANRAAVEAMAKTPGPNLDARLKELGLQKLSTDGDKTDIVIGSMTDNIVGFLRPGAAGAPQIDPRQHVWVEELGGGWYLYRTT